VVLHDYALYKSTFTLLTLLYIVRTMHACRAVKMWLFSHKIKFWGWLYYENYLTMLMLHLRGVTSSHTAPIPIFPALFHSPGRATYPKIFIGDGCQLTATKSQEFYSCEDDI